MSPRRPIDGGADRGGAGPTEPGSGTPVPLFLTRLATGSNILHGGHDRSRSMRSRLMAAF